MSERKKASPHVNGASKGSGNGGDKPAKPAAAKAGGKAKASVGLGVLDRSRALEPATVRVNETVVRRGFWPKVAQVARRVPFAADAVSLWYCLKDSQTPTAAKGLIAAALAYFVIPTDAIPDVVAGLGFTDDAAVIAAVLAVIGRNLKPHHKDAARDFLNRMAGHG